MAAKKARIAGSAPPFDLDLKSEPPPRPVSDEVKRFDIFLIDTGWNTAVSKLVRSHLPLLYQFQPQESLYLLTREQSVEILKRARVHWSRPDRPRLRSLRSRRPQASQLSRLSPQSRPIQAPGTGAVAAAGVPPFSDLAPVLRRSGYRGSARAASRGGPRHDQDPPRGDHRIALMTQRTSLS